MKASETASPTAAGSAGSDPSRLADGQLLARPDLERRAERTLLSQKSDVHLFGYGESTLDLDVAVADGAHADDQI